MALKSNNTALAIAIQSVADTFTTPTQPADLMPFSNCSFSIEGVTIANDEYTGSPFRNADAVAGKKATLSYNLKLRPPGGSIPAANAFLLGRVLQAAKFTESRTTTAIPSSAEAGSSGTTTGLTLGAGATGTLDLYKGMAISLASMGTDYKTRMTAIVAYTAGKVATFGETFGSSVTGNYQLPIQLGYFRDISSADPILISQSLWIDGHRFDLMNCRITGLQIVVPTSTRDQAAFPEIQVTWDCMISDDEAESTPSVTALASPPLYKDGKCWLNQVRIGSQTFTLDLGLQTESPPNPNNTDGSDAAEIVGGVATVSMTRQKYLPAVLDTLSLADLQGYHPFFAQWGNAAGNFVQIVVPQARFDYQNIDMGGNMVMENGNLLIDVLSRSVALNFTY